MARLYADENFPLPVVEALRLRGHDVLTAFEAGQAGQGVPDPLVLAFAQQQGRAVLTLNRKHFRLLHANQPDHGGIIVCTYDPDWDAQAGRIHEAMVSSEALAGCLLRVNRPHR